MSFLSSLCIAIKTYSVLPAPRCKWTEKAMGGSICALPLVGVFPALLLPLWHYLCLKLGVSSLLFAAFATVLPILISGGIHLDGFCDTVDALASHQPPQKKLEILKDSQAGAFAVIYCIVYLLLCFGLYAELYGAFALNAVAGGFMLSRALTALSALTTPNARRQGMLVMFARPADHKRACLISGVFALMALGLMAAFMWQAALGAGALCVVFWWFYRWLALKEFGGVTGDTSGFFLQICELAILLGAWGGYLAERPV